MTTPVASHPLSPEEATQPGRNSRGRSQREQDANRPRPVTSYFTLKSQSDERAALGTAEHIKATPSTSTTPTVTPIKSRKPSVARHSSVSIVPIRLNGNAEETTTRVTSTNFKHIPILTLGEDKNSTPRITPANGLPQINYLSEETTSIVLGVKWHDATDEEITNYIAEVSRLESFPESSNQAHYSILRTLSKQLEGLNLNTQEHRITEKFDTRSLLEENLENEGLPHRVKDLFQDEDDKLDQVCPKKQVCLSNANENTLDSTGSPITSFGRRIDTTFCGSI